MSVDWNQEADALGGDFLKFTQSGRFHVKFLNDGEPDEYVDPESGKRTPQQVFDIEYEGRKMRRSVTKGKTTSSEWGQLALIGRYHGSLADKTLTYIVKYDASKKKGEYTIEEALPLIAKHEEQKNKGSGQPSEPVDVQYVPDKPEQEGDAKKEEPQGSSSGSEMIEKAMEKAVQKELGGGG
jgi:hypothetical protein